MIVKDIYRRNINTVSQSKTIINEQCRNKFIEAFTGIQIKSNWQSLLTGSPNQEYDIDNLRALNTLSLLDDDYIKLMVLESIMGPSFIEGILECSAYLSNFKIPLRYNITSNTFNSVNNNKKINIGIKKETNPEGYEMIYLTKIDFEVPFSGNDHPILLFQANSLLFTFLNPDFCLDHVRSLLVSKDTKLAVSPFYMFDVEIKESSKVDIYNLNDTYSHMKKELEDSIAGKPLFYLYKPGENQPNYWVSMDNTIVLEGNHFNDII